MSPTLSTANPAQMKYPLYSMKVTSWMECTYLEEHLWWIWWNVLVVLKELGDVAPLMVG